MIKEAIAKVIDKIDLTQAEISLVIDEIMSGSATDAQIGSFITALRMKGETVAEITGAAAIMRKHAVKIKVASANVMDTCGTGGDKLGTFNISTTTALVVAGAGIKVAKHGNRSVSSKSGSADVLEALGVNINLSSSLVETCIEKIGIGFLFAPLMHKSMKYAIGPRREIGIRTIFNILGPLTNPAAANVQVMGVFKMELTEVLAKVLNNLGVLRALVVHGADGLDEISICGKTYISELKDGKVNNYTIAPTDFGLTVATLSDIAGNDVATNAKITLDVLRGKAGAPLDITLLNAGAAIYVAGKADNILKGIAVARKVIDSGKALEKLEELKEFSNA